MEDLKVNRKFKDKLFCLLYQEPKRLLELFNALNGTDYQDTKLVEVTTIEDAIYMKMKNDVSFIVNSVMSLYEQQSTYNPNMPLREFEYCAKLYNKYITGKRLDLYGKKLIKLPRPQCFVFYNGNEKQPDRVVLKLSDAFDGQQNTTPQDDLEYEWTTVMLNINRGHNKELLEACSLLKKYSDFVCDIRDEVALYGLETAVDRVVKKNIRLGGEFGDFLERHRSEVIDMCITEYDEELHLATVREEGVEEGFDKGTESAHKQTALQMYKNHEPIEKIVLYTGCEQSVIEAWLQEEN